MALRVA